MRGHGCTEAHSDDDDDDDDASLDDADDDDDRGRGDARGAMRARE